MGLPRLLTQSRNDTAVSGKTANGCLSARNDSIFFCMAFFPCTGSAFPAREVPPLHGKCFQAA
ncbi:MAG: hypothetical protein IIU35_02730 [Neisseriaceae bacterium]|nr:hypothetical protein [Neisseriaceae bacterium]